MATPEELLIQYKNEINAAAKIVGILPRIIASVIYSEHKLNVKLGENVLDFVFARTGYNSSMGIAQVKINTAFWIEKQIHNPNSQFYLGKQIEYLISISKNRMEHPSRNDLIGKLSNPRENIIYAACYIAMIEKIWKPVFNLTTLENPNGTGIKTGIMYNLFTRNLQFKWKN